MAQWDIQPLGRRQVRSSFDCGNATLNEFYLNFGFMPLEDDANHLFLPMHMIRKLTLSPKTGG